MTAGVAWRTGQNHYIIPLEKPVWRIAFDKAQSPAARAHDGDGLEPGRVVFKKARVARVIGIGARAGAGFAPGGFNA